MEIIGVDHGYAAMKTTHYVFPSGVVDYGEHEPYTLQNTLLYNGKYYVCGSGRQPLLRDKTVNDNYYLPVSYTHLDVYKRQVEGVVPLKTMRGDYYEYNREMYCVIGERTREKISLGDSAKICVERVDVDKMCIRDRMRCLRLLPL